MRRWLLLFLLCPLSLMGQSTAVSATITDNQGQVWLNGSYTVNFVPTPGSPGPYVWQGAPFKPQVYQGVLDNTGSFTITLPDNNTITPAGTQWAFVLCPNATAACTTVTTPVTGSTQNLSTLFSSRVVPPVVYAAPMPRAYSASEVPVPPPQTGGQFFRVVDNVPLFWTGTFWKALGGADAIVTDPVAPQTICCFGLTIQGSLTANSVNGVINANAYASLNAAAAACSGPCTIEVNAPISLTSNLTLPATTTLMVNQPGVINQGGNNLVTGPVIAGVYKVFSGGNVTLGVANSFPLVEWFGAIGDGNQTGSGTDNTTAIQACLNSITKGQCVLQSGSYMTTSTLNITHSQVGFLGQQSSLPSSGLYPTPSPSEIIINSASADVVDVSGTSTSNTIAFNRFENLTLARSLVPTGTARGLALMFVDGAWVSGVTSEDSIAPFYIHGMASQGVGIIQHSAAMWGYNGVTETSGSMGGFVLDSSSSTSNNSAKFSYDATFSNLPHSGSYTTFGFEIEGDQTHDAFVDNYESATVDYGMLVSQNVGFGIAGSTDIHITNMINDSCFVTCLKVNEILGSVEISGGWEATSVSATNTPAVEIDNSTNVGVNHVDVYASAGTAGTPAVKVDTSTLTRIENSNITVLSTSAEDGVSFTNDTAPILQGNTVHLLGSGSTNGVTISNNVAGGIIQGNSVQGTATNGIIVAAGSNGIIGLGNNTIGATAFGTITNFLVNNGSNAIVLWAPGSPGSTCNNPGELYMNSITTVGTFPTYQCKGTTWVGIGTAY